MPSSTKSKYEKTCNFHPKKGRSQWPKWEENRAKRREQETKGAPEAIMQHHVASRKTMLREASYK